MIIILNYSNMIFDEDPPGVGISGKRPELLEEPEKEELAMRSLL